MTIEELLKNEDDLTLLNIHDELESCLIPATSYAHDYVRKINRMIDEGKLCVVPGKYRNVYLPTISKMIYKELARRYAAARYGAKGPELRGQTSLGYNTVRATPLERNDEQDTCEWCNCDGFEPEELHSTDLGMLCKHCIDGIRSRGDIVCVYD
jgi:hypothetical protein